jgi:hypothetical protein
LEARFFSMVVTGRPVIEILNDDDDDVGLDVALGEAPGVTPGVEPGISLGVLLDAEPFAGPTPGTVFEPVVLPADARMIMIPVGDFGPGLAKTNVPGRLVAIDSPNSYSSNVNAELLPRWRNPTAMEAHLRIASFQRM